MQEERPTFTQNDRGVDTAERTPPAARLRFTAGSLMGVEFEIRGSLLLLGRSGACDIRLSDDSDLLVSGRHASITVRDGVHWLEDLHSRNHTFVNGVRILEPTPIASDDEISLGPPGAEGACAACFLASAASAEKPLREVRGREPRPCLWCLASRRPDATGDCTLCALPELGARGVKAPWDLASMPALLALLDAVTLDERIRIARAGGAERAERASLFGRIMQLFRAKNEPKTPLELAARFASEIEKLVEAAEDAVFRDPAALREANPAGSPSVREVLEFVTKRWLRRRGEVDRVVAAHARAAARARSALREAVTDLQRGA